MINFFMIHDYMYDFKKTRLMADTHILEKSCHHPGEAHFSRLKNPRFLQVKIL
jgi:hypothetical protein